MAIAPNTPIRFIGVPKFDRKYQLIVETRLTSTSEIQTLTFQLPTTLEFDIVRKNLASSMIAKFRLYNLSLIHREIILHDYLDLAEDVRNVTLNAGYGKNLQTIFSGRIRESKSYREGVDFITEIDAFDVGADTKNVYLNVSPDAQSTNRDFLVLAATQLSQYWASRNFTLNIGAIGNGYSNLLNASTSFGGPIVESLSENSGSTFYIDNNNMYFLADNEVIEGLVPVINTNDGLLSTPIREQQYLNFSMIFEPSLTVGQLIGIQSVDAPNYNGLYKVINIQHKGTISGAVCGDAVTYLGVQMPDGNFSTIPGYVQ